MKLESSPLSVYKLCVNYGKETILNEVDLFNIRSGQLTIFIGPNGAGKSTLLRAIAGLTKARGIIKWNEQNLLSLKGRERAKIIGYMPQSIPVTNGLTVLESVSITSQMLIPMMAMRKHTDQALLMLEKIGIVNLAMKRLGSLSGGQRQLVSLAQTLVCNPNILLLDEPTSALDLKYQIKIMMLLKSIASSGYIVMIVLHDLTLAYNWADHLVFLHNGHVIDTGHPKDVLTSERFKQIYGVKTSMARTEDGAEHLVIDRLFADLPTEERKNCNESV